jgi:hypothetical protein
MALSKSTAVEWVRYHTHSSSWLIRRFDPEAAAEWMIMNIDNPDVDAPLNPNQLRRLLAAFQQGGISPRFRFFVVSVLIY